jgi:hypothetical protein
VKSGRWRWPHHRQRISEVMHLQCTKHLFGALRLEARLAPEELLRLVRKGLSGGNRSFKSMGFWRLFASPGFRLEGLFVLLCLLLCPVSFCIDRVFCRSVYNQIAGRLLWFVVWVGIDKLRRASGGCLGAKRRRRTRQAAIFPGERQRRKDPGVSEWGNPAVVMGGHQPVKESLAS